jgi:kynurenine formamidase
MQIHWRDGIRRFFWRSGPVVLAALVLSACAHAPEFPQGGQWLDLTHDFSGKTVYWPTSEPFRLTIDHEGVTDKGFFYAANNFRAAEHGGTHIDAPIHFAARGQFLDQVPLDKLIGPAVVVDVSTRALADRDYRIGVADLAAWEAKHGPIPEGSIVLLHTGYARFWPDAEKYLGTAERGPAGVAKLRFPGLHSEAARWLVSQRRIRAVGLDTASIDYGQSTLFESHRVLARENIPIFENVTQLDRLPASGALVFALPMKIAGGSGGPLRIVAWLPKEK